MKTLSAFWRVIRTRLFAFWNAVEVDRRFWEDRWKAAKWGNEDRQRREKVKAECPHLRMDGTTTLVLFTDGAECGCRRNTAICQRCQLVTKDPYLLNQADAGWTHPLPRPRPAELQPLYDMPLDELKKLAGGGA